MIVINDVPKFAQNVPNKFSLPHPSLKKRGNTFSIRLQIPRKILSMNNCFYSDLIISLGKNIDYENALKILTRIKKGFNRKKYLEVYILDEYKKRIKEIVKLIINDEYIKEKNDDVYRIIFDLLSLEKKPTSQNQFILFSEWFPKYQDEKIKGGEWKKNTQLSNQSAFNELVSYLEAKDLSKLEHNDYIEIRNEIYNLKTKGKSKDNYDKIKATINNRLAILISFMDWLQLKDKINTHKAKDIKFKENRSPNERKDAYSDNQCRKIAHNIRLMGDNPIRVKGKSGASGLKYLHQIIMIGMYTGARLMEIAQLTKSDFIKNNNGEIKAIHIHGNLKNLSSKRLVPIGDLPHWFQIDSSLFRNTTSDTYQYYSEKAISQRVNNELEKLLTDDKKMNLSFHSFRHSFETRASKFNNINQTHINQITGRAFKDTGRKVYLAKNKNLEDIDHLFETINKINSELLKNKKDGLETIEINY